MQDLVISRSVTRRVTQLTATVIIDGNTLFVIPPNVNRVWCYAYSALDNAPTPLRVQVNETLFSSLPSSDGTTGLGVLANSMDLPGIFSSPLLVTDPGGQVWLVEAVMDTPLGMAVQNGYSQLLAGEH
jgi:hypothetical protein